MEKWFSDFKVLRKSLATQIVSVPAKSNEGLSSAHIMIDETDSLTEAARGLSLLGDRLPADTATECVISQSFPNQSEDIQTSTRIIDDIKPNDSISNVGSKRSSKRSHSSGSQASRSSVSSARL